MIKTTPTPNPERVYVVLSGRGGHRFADLFDDRAAALDHFHFVSRFDRGVTFRVMAKRSKPKAPRPIPDTPTPNVHA